MGNWFWEKNIPPVMPEFSTSNLPSEHSPARCHLVCWKCWNYSLRWHSCCNNINKAGIDTSATRDKMTSTNPKLYVHVSAFHKNTSLICLSFNKITKQDHPMFASEIKSIPCEWGETELTTCRNRAYQSASWLLSLILFCSAVQWLILLWLSAECECWSQCSPGPTNPFQFFMRDKMQ